MMEKIPIFAKPNLIPSIVLVIVPDLVKKFVPPKPLYLTIKITFLVWNLRNVTVAAVAFLSVLTI